LLSIEEIKKQLSLIESKAELETVRAKYLGGNGILAAEMKKIRVTSASERPQRGKELNELKKQIEELFATQSIKRDNAVRANFIDYSKPGKKTDVGHLHLITQAINEITEVFEKIGFTRVRHPEIDSDYYAFESLNMPKDHPARDEWETFFITTQNDNNSQIVLTPHTSNGQVREMEKNKLPIRMINIAKCYRRQSDISHSPMFHQFEGMYIDKHVSIKHLIGVIDYFGKQFFGKNTRSRIRPFHFQFTEPSFEVDFSCSWCDGRGCRLCKEGWLELGGSGMIHPNVLRAGGIDPTKYSGFAFGWGVERTYMIKCGFLSDLRTMYSTDIRILNQF
jgi:phenylalanyl-tRNA synthetase alpha chain